MAEILVLKTSIYEIHIMNAILITLMFKYESNPDNKRVQIWLQSFLTGNIYDCKHWNLPLDEIVRKWGLEVLSAIFEFALIFALYQKRLHSYLDLNVSKIAFKLFAKDSFQFQTWRFSILNLKKEKHFYI